MTFFHFVELLQPHTSFIFRARENTPTAFHSRWCVFSFPQMPFVSTQVEVALTITPVSVWKIIRYVKFGSLSVFLRFKPHGALTTFRQHVLIIEQLQQMRPHAGRSGSSPTPILPWSPSTSNPSIAASSTDMPSPFHPQVRLLFDILSKWWCGLASLTWLPLCSAPPVY